jgi:hypothetical protein
MAIPEKRRINPSVETEIDLFAARAREFAEGVSVHSSAGIRARDVATLAISFWDMIDSIDHRTSTQMGGTPEIQDFAQAGRESARQFTEDVADTD